MRGFYTAYLQVGAMIYGAFVTNVLLALVNLPLLFLFVATDVRSTWLPILALSPVLAVSIVAAFSVFERITTSGSASVVREFFHSLRVHAPRSARAGAVVAIGVFVLAVDIVAVQDSPVGALAIPFFLTSMLLLLATGLHVLVGIGLDVTVSGDKALWKACLYLAIRRWYLTLMTLMALWLLVAFIYAMPAWGMGLLASPLLFLAWTNTRQALLPVAPNANRIVVPE